MKKNTKIIRLTENDLERMVRRIIKESDDETSTPIKPITIHGKTYKFVEDLPTRELGIGGYTVQDGIVMVDGETPLQDWLTQDMDTNEDYMSSEEDLIDATYNLMYDLGVEYVEDLYIQDLYEAAEILEDELYEGNHGLEDGQYIMDQKIEDLLTNIYEIIGYPDAEEYESKEDYMEDMPKPGIGQKLKQSLRDLSGIGNKNDNATLKQIHALIAKGAVDNVRRQPNGITAWVNNEALILDIEMPEIIYAGRNLEVTNLESKVLDLYSELLDFI